MCPHLVVRTHVRYKAVCNRPYRLRAHVHGLISGGQTKRVHGLLRSDGNLAHTYACTHREQLQLKVDDDEIGAMSAADLTLCARVFVTSIYAA